MPEAPEIETERLHEAIHEELEREGGAFLRKVALSTALLAALAAIASLQAGATVNEALVLKAEATRLQAEASDQWAYYQAKGVKAAVQEAIAASWQAAGKQAPPAAAEDVARYAAEQKTIRAKAEEKEAERDRVSSEADHLLHHHHRFAGAVALFQVAIALGAVAALTRHRLIWAGSVVVGLVGLVLAAIALLA
ncbi:MAG TPA: DUF4337 family protein [Anaeromyxobacter sp.]|nr:DUF4337 family protein [Anaeromyxobacter sp.]